MLDSTSYETRGLKPSLTGIPSVPSQPACGFAKSRFTVLLDTGMGDTNTAFLNVRQNQSSPGDTEGRHPHTDLAGQAPLKKHKPCTDTDKLGEFPPTAAKREKKK